MRVLLCAINSKYIHSTLGVWYLLSSVKNIREVECKVVESTINEKEEEIFNKISREEADIVAFSTYIWNKEMVLHLSERLKAKKKVKILLGGPEVSYNAREMMEKCPYVDYIISGEGEEPFARLCSGESPELIPGVFCKIMGDVCEKEPFVSVIDPPNPYTAEYFESLKGRIVYIETSRGCPYRCTFCLSGRCGGVRFFDLERSKENIVLLANSGTQTVKFVDRTFNANKKRAREIFDFIIREYDKKIPRGVCFHFEMEGELVDEETLELLKKAPKGLFQFEIGVQSFNEKTLKAINRHCNFERLTKNIRSLVEMGNIHIHIDLIIGLPFEDVKSFERSFNNAYELHPHMLQMGFLKLLHGADLRENEEHKSCFNDTPPYEIESNEWLSQAELKKLHLFEDVFEKLYNSQRFALTCEYLRESFSNMFKTIMDFSEFEKENSNGNTLDEFTRLIYEYFSEVKGLDKKILRDKLAIDRLATNKMGSLPEFLKVHSPKIKYALNELEKDERTKRPKNVKRAATVLLTENSVAYVDYDSRDYVTNRFLVKFTKKLGS